MPNSAYISSEVINKTVDALEDFSLRSPCLDTRIESNDVVQVISFLTSDNTRYLNCIPMLETFASSWVNDKLSGSHDDQQLSRDTQISLLENALTAVSTEVSTLSDRINTLSVALPDQAGTNRTATQAAIAQAEKYVSCLHDLQNTLQKELNREKTPSFSIAFFGMVKAGKSLFLNALIGHQILPSGDLPSTAWPCRIRHVPRLVEPKLEINLSDYQPTINAIREKQYGNLISRYELQRENLSRTTQSRGAFRRVYNFLTYQDDNQQESEEQHNKNGVAEGDIEARKQDILYRNWIDLAPSTKQNLLIFEDEKFQLRTSVNGIKEVNDLLGQINDIIRLSVRLGIEPLPRFGAWPLISVEFTSLCDQELQGLFEFIDLPGVGEAFEEFKNFEDVVRYVVDEVNIVLPIVSYKEAARQDWRAHLPRILNNTPSRTPELVICTHLDLIENVEEYNRSISKVLWPGDLSRAHVMGCSSRLGLSAITLIQKSRTQKPEFSSSWLHPDSVEYSCVRDTIGISSSRSKRIYDSLDLEEWKQELLDRYRESGFYPTVQTFISLMKTARRRALISGGQLIESQLNRLISFQSFLFLQICRSEEECRRNLDDFLSRKNRLEHAIESWRTTETNLRQQIAKTLEGSIQKFSADSEHSVSVSVRDAKNDVLSVHGPSGIVTIRDGDLCFYDNAISDEFMRKVADDVRKKLYVLRSELWNSVQQSSFNIARKHIEVLKEMVQEQFGDSNELISQIAQEVNDHAGDFESVSFSHLDGNFFDQFGGSAGWLVEAFELITCQSRDRRRRLVLKEDALINELRAKAWSQFVQVLSNKARNAFDKTAAKNSSSAVDKLRKTLSDVEEMYSIELAQKNQNRPPEFLASIIALYTNAVTVKFALLQIRGYLEKL